MDIKLDPSRDDLPLMANTSHILVKHYVLDLDVDFESQIFEGTIVLFFEPGNRFKKWSSSTEVACGSESNEACRFRMPEPCQSPVTSTKTFSSKIGYDDFVICGKGGKDTSGKDGNHGNQEQASGISSSKHCCDTENHGSEEFLLVLDCCDLSVLKVEEVDVAAAPGIEKFTRSPELRNQIVHELVALPADRWREQLDCYARCSQAPSCGELLFDTDPWSLQIRKTGAQTATDFPHAIRIRYRTKPQGRSVTWTSDQSGRPCVYTVGSPINNRALFPCQEPPVAMSTWQATVRAAASFVVLMSGENSAKPTQLREVEGCWYSFQVNGTPGEGMEVPCSFSHTLPWAVFHLAGPELTVHWLSNPADQCIGLFLQVFISLWRLLYHLTCLLRNLYAGQEATVRTGQGTTDWFQIGKGVHQGCIFFLIIFSTISKVTQSCLTLCDPMDCSLPGSSIHGIFQARVLEECSINGCSQFS
ncbi:hypothetical protein FD755_014733 [Muntiacus reevesi]|uniref:Aminopeptidase O (putative) n=1 Tax=Muntiacus reevesi TaxID=9886 RepID=A0A5N3XIJ8_MUNRE|nr:hypothetical protein FD755_014733 [Muntiacus reevesi]